MTAWAFVIGGIVTNCVQADDPPNPLWFSAVTAEFDAVVDITSLDHRPAIGWLYDGTTFFPPPDTDPEP